MTMTLLDKAILRTIVYFDLMDYPLTAAEVWKWLYKPEGSQETHSYARVLDALQHSETLRIHLSCVEAFYCLRGREDLIVERKWRNNRVDRQMRLLRRIVKVLRFFPSIRMIAYASSLSFGNVKPTSDIDLFIITKENQIWWTRFLAAGLLKLLRLRPREHDTTNKFCLTFFISEESLNIEQVSNGHEDIVFQYYIQSFTPVYDPFGVYAKFLAANTWWERFLPNAYYEQGSVIEVDCPVWLHWWHDLFEWITWPLYHGPLENWYCNLQLRIMPERLKSIANIDTRVILSDTMLKFHDKDNRHEIKKKWQERMAHFD